MYEILFGIEPPKNYFEEGQEGYYFTESLEWVIEYASNIRNWLGVNTVFPSLRPGKKEFYQHVSKLSKRINANKDYWLKHPSDDEECLEIFPRLLNACEKGLLRDEAIIMDMIFAFGAAQVSTSSTTAVALYYLSKDQALQDAARAEINMTFDGELPGNSRDLNQLKITQGIINEALRLAPPLAFTIGNTSRQECQIGADILIDAGSRVHCCLHIMHRDPEYFDDPEKFDPSRWLTDDAKKLARMNRAFKPFGFGEPACPGRSLATVELVTIAAAILKSYRVRVSPDLDFGSVEEKLRRIHSLMPIVSDIRLVFEKI